MEKILLYLAISFSAAASLLYLWRAFSQSPAWGWSSVLLPPVALLFYAVYWDRVKKLACLHIVAFSVMLLSVVMAVRSHPLAFDGPILSNIRAAFAPASFGEPLLLPDQMFATKSHLSRFNFSEKGRFGGKIRNEVMIVDEVTLVDGVIRFTQGSGFFSEKQISIALGGNEFLSQLEQKSSFNKRRWQVLVTPDQYPVPLVYVQTKHSAAEFPEFDIIESGYWMDLSLELGAQNLISGHVRLLLPGEEKSFLTGYFDGHTDALRYQDGEIDRTVHSNETLHHVVNLHFEKRLGYQLDSIVRFENTFYDLNGMHPQGRTLVTFRLNDGEERTEAVDLFYSNDGWGVAEQSTQELIAAIKQLEIEPPSAGPLVVMEPIVLKPEDAGQLLGKHVSVKLRGNKERQGVLQDVTPFELTLRTQVEGGHVEVLIVKREVVSITSVKSDS
ncbi:hypothetical protein A9Q99_04520 [Gammaproteobacteria bacterium 45_16_T64]|nr:hypothetical protein A9Q99_04520 [Gammaproteobacteria bacterium 45_16_T64]